MKFTKVIPERKVTYEVEWARYYMTRQENLKACIYLDRKPQIKCFLCGTKFSDDENMHLALVEKHGGQEVCESCGNKCKSPK
jgi:hypothetical protein